MKVKELPILTETRRQTQSLDPITISEMRRLLARNLANMPGDEKVMFKFEMIVTD